MFPHSSFQDDQERMSGMSGKVLVTSLLGDTGPHFEILAAAGFQTVVVDRTLDLRVEENLIRELHDAVACIAGSEPFTARVIESCPKLRVIARTGVGFDAVHLPTCDQRRIVVATTPGVNHHAVAEHTIAMLMALARNLPQRDREVRQGIWEREATPRVMGRTIGLIGLGRIGRAVATRARGLGLNVLAYDPYPNREFAEQWQVELTSLDNLLSRSDFVSLHLPMDPSVRHLINAETLQKMKPTAILINTARGPLVDEVALAEALRSGRLRAAGLDVFETEPLPLDSPLLQLDNVLTCGHQAGLDEESQRDTLVMAAQIVVDLKQGRWPTECIRNLAGVKDWRW
jgi:D-3-phosphoglycerate dehydrogenase